MISAPVLAQTPSGYDTTRLDALFQAYEIAMPVPGPSTATEQLAPPAPAPSLAPGAGPAPAPSMAEQGRVDTCPFTLSDIPGQVAPLVEAAGDLREKSQTTRPLMGQIRNGLAEIYATDSVSLECSRQLLRDIDTLTGIIDGTDTSAVQTELTVLSSCVVEKAARVQSDIDEADAEDDQRKRRQFAGLLTRLSEDDERIKNALIVTAEASKAIDRAIQARDAAKAECTFDIDY